MQSAGKPSAPSGLTGETFTGGMGQRIIHPSRVAADPSPGQEGNEGLQCVCLFPLKSGEQLAACSAVGGTSGGETTGCNGPGGEDERPSQHPTQKPDKITSKRPDPKLRRRRGRFGQPLILGKLHGIAAVGRSSRGDHDFGAAAGVPKDGVGGRGKVQQHLRFQVAPPSLIAEAGDVHDLVRGRASGDLNEKWFAGERGRSGFVLAEQLRSRVAGHGETGVAFVKPSLMAADIRGKRNRGHISVGREVETDGGCLGRIGPDHEGAAVDGFGGAGDGHFRGGGGAVVVDRMAGPSSGQETWALWSVLKHRGLGAVPSTPL